MQGDKPNYFQGHRICMDQNNSLQLNKSQLNSFTKKLEHRRLTNIARQIEYFLEISLCSFDNRAPRKQQKTYFTYEESLFDLNDLFITVE